MPRPTRGSSLLFTYEGDRQDSSYAAQRGGNQCAEQEMKERPAEHISHHPRVEILHAASHKIFVIAFGSEEPVLERRSSQKVVGCQYRGHVGELRHQSPAERQKGKDEDNPYQEALLESTRGGAFYRGICKGIRVELHSGVRYRTTIVIRCRTLLAGSQSKTRPFASGGASTIAPKERV